MTESHRKAIRVIQRMRYFVAKRNFQVRMRPFGAKFNKNFNTSTLRKSLKVWHIFAQYIYFKLSLWKVPALLFNYSILRLPTSDTVPTLLKSAYRGLEVRAVIRAELTAVPTAAGQTKNMLHSKLLNYCKRVNFVKKIYWFKLLYIITYSIM